jgi:hypothetical protein
VINIIVKKQLCRDFHFTVHGGLRMEGPAMAGRVWSGQQDTLFKEFLTIFKA